MQKYIGGIEGFLEQDAAKESAFWADYQVLGPMFAALRMFMTMDDVLTVIVCLLLHISEPTRPY